LRSQTFAFSFFKLSAAPCGLSGNAPKAAAGREASALQQAKGQGRLEILLEFQGSGVAALALAWTGGGFSVRMKKAGGG
jgi:hypothetical protein